jgi:hypothetical protein
MKTKRLQIKSRQTVKSGGSAARQFDRKLARYALAGSALLAAPMAADAEIVFSGPVDEVVSNGGYLSVSFDKSAETDFTLTAELYNSGGGYYATAEGYTFVGSDSAGVTIGAVTGNIGPSTYLPTVGYMSLNYYETYYDDVEKYRSYQYSCGHSNFGRTDYCTGYSYYYVEEGPYVESGGVLPIDSGSPYYLGFDFTRSGNTFYGWAQVETYVTANSAEVELIDYAYNNTPSTPILAGDEASPVPEPSSIALFAMGAAGLAVLRRRTQAHNS